MDTKDGNTTIIRALCIMVLFTILFSGSGLVQAANTSPFTGHWLAIDLDVSNIQLTIGGPPNGPFNITSTDDYISYCNGEPGIIRGEGWLNENDPNLLEAELKLECFTTGETLNLYIIFQYHPSTNMLSSNWYGRMIVWSRSGPPQEPPPSLKLRVNYGHDWVESFYPEGHTAWISITEEDGKTVLATAEVLTDFRVDWGGLPGFHTNDFTWFDGDGNPMDSPPDIQPYNWVFGWVDNGASAQVQIGEISGQVSYQTDIVTGTINAPWITEPVSVECLDWGSGEDPPLINKDAGNILTNGADLYSCAWAGDWDILPYQDVGVGYWGPDGHWVANTFTTPFPRIIASEAGDWFWVTEFYPGFLDVYLYESADEGAAVLWSGFLEAEDLDEIAYMGPDMHGLDLQPGNYLVISDGVNEKGLVLEPIATLMFNTLEDYMAGTAPFGRDVQVGVGFANYQDTIWVVADEVIPGDPETGGWYADFTGVTDMIEGMRWWSWAQIYDADWDANEGLNPTRPEIRVWLSSNRVEGYFWPLGSEISLYIDDFGTPLDTQIVTEGDVNWTRVEFDLHGWVLEPGQEIWMIGGGTEKFHTILPVSITNVDAAADIVYGGVSPGESVILCIYDGGCDPPMEIFDEDEDGAWQMDYGAIFDILPGFGMDATEFDYDGDGTSYEYWVP
ncbi:hypothetical protein KQH61_05420 [bacterium]|nr:hypothetical protein [bacterium]MCB2179341.1 hypothetical protein [bacterium]